MTEIGESYTVPSFIIEPDYCPYAYQVTYTELPLPAAGASKSALSSDDGITFEFFYDTEINPLAQKQIVYLIATSYSIYGVSSPQE